MKKIKLLEYKYKKIGWFLLIPSLIAGLIFFVFGYELPQSPTILFFGFFDNLFNSNKSIFRIDEIDLISNLIGILFLIGGVLIMFSKEEREDEFINQLRLSAIQSAVFINYLLLLFCILFIHGFYFYKVMVYNLFTIIIIYIVRFYFLVSIHSTTKNEE